MNLNRFTIILALSLACGLPAYSQDNNNHKEDDNSDFTDNIFVGGNFGLGFGDRTYIEISPIVGYKISSRFSAGVGAMYQYLNYKAYDVSSHTYGGRLFGTGKIKEPFFGQIEYEYINYEHRSINGELRRMESNSVFVGGGIAQPISDNVAIVVTALYNITYDDSYGSFYNSPFVFRVGFTVGF